MTQPHRSLIAVGTVAIIMGTYLQIGPDDPFPAVVWTIGAAALSAALWLAWRNRAIQRRILWLIVAGVELLFCFYLIINVLRHTA
jgi:hypothetical protein